MHEKICFIVFINPYKPTFFFVGHRQTVETQTRRHITRRLIRTSTVCLQNVLSKFEYMNKIKTTTQQRLKGKWTGPYDTVGNSIWHKWVLKSLGKEIKCEAFVREFNQFNNTGARFCMTVNYFEIAYLRYCGRHKNLPKVVYCF